MTIHEYMAMGRKLSKADDRSNIAIFLALTAAGIGVAYYFKIQQLIKYKDQNMWLHQDNNRLKTENRQQGEANSHLLQKNASQQQTILRLENEKQSLVVQLMKKESKEPQA